MAAQGNSRRQIGVGDSGHGRRQLQLAAHSTKNDEVCGGGTDQRPSHASGQKQGSDQRCRWCSRTHAPPTERVGREERRTRSPMLVGDVFTGVVAPPTESGPLAEPVP